MQKREELQTEYQSLLTREREIVDHINLNSPSMTVEEIQEMDHQRRLCVASRRELRKKMAVLDDLMNLVGKRGSSAVDVLKSLMEEKNETPEN